MLRTSRGDIKWRQSNTLLQRPEGLKITVGEGARTGVLSCETKWSKEWRGWGDLEPDMIFGATTSRTFPIIGKFSKTGGCYLLLYYINISFQTH